MNYLEFYNKPIGTDFYRGRGRNTKVWRLVKKQTKEFGELRMILQGGPSVKPVYIFWDEYDSDEWFDLMRIKP